jgi:hypothetical protein
VDNPIILHPKEALLQEFCRQITKSLENIELEWIGKDLVMCIIEELILKDTTLKTPKLLYKIALEEAIRRITKELKMKWEKDIPESVIERYLVGKDVINYAKELHSIKKERLDNPEVAHFSQEMKGFILEKPEQDDMAYGIRAIPTYKKCLKLNIDKLRKESKQFRVEGDDFPFEILYKEALFVLNGDGTIYVSTENMDTERVQQVLNWLTNLASLVYEEINDEFCT